MDLTQNEFYSIITYMNLDIKTRLDNAFFTIIRLPMDPQKVNDLKKLWKNCSQIWTDMNKEEIECRRLSKSTIHYKELEKELLDGLEMLEQYLTFATLLS